jgi:hypothetical protein
MEGEEKHSIGGGGSFLYREGLGVLYSIKHLVRERTLNAGRK